MKKLLIASKVMLFLMAAHSVSAATVCLVGDSVVKRGGYWRHYMAQSTSFQYVGNYTDDYLYLHDGVGGDTTRDVLDRIDTIPACAVTILHVGGNDLVKQERLPGAIANNLRLIADTLATRGSIVYVGTILPCNGCGTDANLAIAVTNYKIKEAVSGAHTVVDHWKAIVDSGLPAWWLYVDAVHPSDIGYRVLAEYDLQIITP